MSAAKRMFQEERQYQNTLDMDDLTPFERFQLERYGNVLPRTKGKAELENGFEQSERDAEWTAINEEMELFNHE